MWKIILILSCIRVHSTADLTRGVADFTASDPTLITLNSTAVYTVTQLTAGKFKFLKTYLFRR
jgi:hypothetical protein